jgi:myxalamid-type polyketide synthase MxaE and MxaD
VRPGAAIGVSCGEIAAACLAGVLTTEEALAVSFHLGLRLAALPPSGMLAAVARSADRAFHSPAVEPIRVGLTEDLRGLAPRAARLPLASSVTGRLEDGSALGAGSWWRVARLPFDLAGAAAAIIESGLTTFLELGPQASLGLPLQECLSASGRDGEVIASVRRAPGGPRWTLLAAAARLYELGHNVVPYQEPGPSAVLPSYPWRLDRHWVGPAAGPALAARLTAADRWQRRDTLTMAIATEVGRLLGVPAEEVDQKRGFFDLGLCSADAVALRHSLERALGFRLPPTLAFDYPTIERLADHLTTAGTGAEET